MMPAAAWPALAAPPPLAGDVVHVWRAWLDPPPAVVAAYAATLAPDERERASAFRFGHLQDRFTVGRGVLRRLLAGYLASQPEAVRFAYTAAGKPFLAASEIPLRFNLAHTEGLALYAVALGREIGVDVERMRPLPDAARIARRYFSAHEQAALADLAPADREAGFFRCWTRKEAYLKARGEGLGLPLDSFDVSLGPDEPARLVASRVDPRDADRWALAALDPAPGYAAALAVEGHGWRAVVAEWRA